jgi:deoxyribonuclease-1-like protein
VPRSFSLLVLAAIVGGGWYVFKGPGLGQLSQYVGTAQSGQQQSAPAGYYPQQYPTGSNYGYPGGTAQPTSQYAAPYVTAAPATPSPSPLYGGPTIRIASFNIQAFGDEKSAKLPVMWTLAKIIQEFHVVAIQEIRTRDDYLLDRFVRDYVNQGGQRRYDYVIGPRLGRSNNTEQYAFIYDTATIEVNRRSIYTVNDPDDLLHREPLVAMFRVRGPPPQEAFTFVLIDVHIDSDETDTELDALGQVYEVVRQAAGGEDDIIVLGDLSVDDQHLGRLSQISGIRPVVRGIPTNTRQTRQYDNIVLHQPSTAEFTGRGGVYDVQHLLNLTLDQALQVSDHLPVWAELSAYESIAPGRVATRGHATNQVQ